jgi:hypothetical protein
MFTQRKMHALKRKEARLGLEDNKRSDCDDFLARSQFRNTSTNPYYFPLSTLNMEAFDKNQGSYVALLCHSVRTETLYYCFTSHNAVGMTTTTLGLPLVTSRFCIMLEETYYSAMP